MKTFFRLLSIGAMVLTVAACGNYDPSLMARTYLIPQHTDLSAEPEWIKPDAVLMKQEVRGEGTGIIINADYLAAIGEPVPIDADFANAELRFQLIGTYAGGIVYCPTYDPDATTGLAKFFMSTVYKMVCLQDTDRDGLFDQMLKKQSVIFPMPIVWGQFAKPEPLLRPLAYRFDASGVLDRAYYMEIRYTGTPWLQPGNRRFELYGGSSEEAMRPILADWLLVPIKELPARLAISGAIVDILEVDGDRLKVSRVAPIASTPFTLQANQNIPNFYIVRY